MNRSATAFVFGALAIALAAPAAPAARADTILERIQQRGTLRVCQIDYPPLNRRDPATGRWTGLLVDMSEAFATALELRVEHVDSTWGAVVPNIRTGRCDVSAAATFVTARRAVEVLFTQTVTEDTQAAFVHRDSNFNSYADLDQPGRTIIVISGSLNEQNARATFQRATIRAVVSDRQQTAVLEVAGRRADAAFLSTLATLNFIAANENVPVRQVDRSRLFPTPVAWMLPRGEYHFQQVLNAWLTTARANGTLQQLEQRWLAPR